MKNVLRSKTLIQMVGLFAIVVVISAWQQDTTNRVQQNENNNSYRQDTTTPKSARSNQINIQLNLDSAMQQVNAALAKIDYSKINSDVQKALAQIDYKKINREINAGMKEINWNEIKSNVSNALDSAKASIDSIRWDEIKVQLNKARLEMASQRINIDSIQKEVQKSLKEARKSLQSAQKEIANYSALKTALEKDGLLKHGAPYSFELKDGILYINGVKQTKAVTDKYSQFYSGKKNFSISDDGKDEADL